MKPGPIRISTPSKVVAITGADGMLGTELVKQLRRSEGYRVVPLTLADMDITDLLAVRRTMDSLRPDILVHTAAFTQVDTSEKDPLQALMVNAEGTKNLAFSCREQDIEMIFISTDYVFDGKKGSPYLETDPTCPINTYGRSKELGERYVATLVKRHKIVRTSWLNGLGGVFVRNFIETILKIAEHRNQLSVVNDQIGRPTFTFDLARRLILMFSIPETGVFHLTNSGQCSWYDLALAIVDQANLSGVTVQPIPSTQFRALAQRPAFSVLENRCLAELGFDPLPHWKESLREYFRRRRLRERAMQPPPPQPDLTGAAGADSPSPPSRKSR